MILGTATFAIHGVLAAAGGIPAAAQPGPAPSGSGAWLTWSAAVLDTARRENRPVLVFARYFACHPCEAVERESGAGDAGGRARDLLWVKVDGDERPDVAATFGEAAAALGAPAESPIAVALLPDGRPFAALALGASARPAGTESLSAFAARQAHAYRTDRAAVEAAAERVAAAVRERLHVHAPPRPMTAADTRAALALLESSAARAPNPMDFPPARPRADVLEYLARRARMDDASASARLGKLLDALARGTLRDHVGGGFFSGASAVAPAVPHFEKTLAHNAVLLRAFARAFALTHGLLDRDVAREIVTWAVREMRDAGGDFWSSIHAESEGADGAYYLWTEDEVARSLGRERAAELKRSYQLVPPGLLVLTGSPFAGLGATQQVLFSRRARRVRPPTDGRIEAGANGLMIGALSASGSALGWGSDLETARRAADAVMRRLGPARALRHSSAGGEAREAAVLEDYAYLAAGLLDLHEATREPRWRDDAVGLVEAAVRRLWDVDEGGFYGTAERVAPLAMRIRTARDTDLPSGNAVLASVLLRLGRLTGESRYTRLAERTLQAFAAELDADPARLGSLALIAEEWLGGSGAPPIPAPPAPPTPPRPSPR